VTAQDPRLRPYELKRFALQARFNRRLQGSRLGELTVSDGTWLKQGVIAVGAPASAKSEVPGIVQELIFQYLILVQRRLSS
jgi:hypothetical protein